MYTFMSGIHLKVYDDMVNGRFRPSLFHMSRRKVLEKLIFDANTVKVSSLRASDDFSTFYETNFCCLGYKSVTDYEVRLIDSENGLRDVFIAPLSKYKLRELIDLPHFNSCKCNCFLELLGDEFERIKIRSEWLMENSEFERPVRIYANRHLQKAKMLFHDARFCLKETLEKKDQDDVYIVFALNLFIVRTILFFQKFFRPFIIVTKEETEEQLVSELIREVTLCKLGALFSCNGKRNCIYKEHPYQGLPESCNKECAETDSEETVPLSTENMQLRFNGQVNVLVDIFIQLFEELKIDGKPVIETNYRQLEEFLVRNFLDKTGKPLSRHTIITLLKPYRTDKRLSPQSRRRINMEKIIRRKDDNV